MECTIGGTRRHLVDVARGQHRAGLDVHLVASTLRDPGFPQDLDALEAEGVGVTRLDMVRQVSPRIDRAHARRIEDLLRDLRPDVVHTHSSKAGVLGRHASLRSGIGLRVHTPHTFAFLFSALFGPVKRRLYRAVERHYSSRTGRLIAVSPSEAETFRSCGVVPHDRIRVVPNGIDPARFEGAPAADLAALGLDPSRPVAAVVGLLYAAKGQDLALRAAAAVPDLQLLLVGPGDPSPLTDLARELGVQDRVVLTGPRDDVPSLLAAVDLLLLPSRWEGMPYIVLEAMAAGLPVVAHPVDGALDLVEHGVTGYLTGAVGTEQLGAGLVAMLERSDQDRAALGAAGRVRVRAEYTIERMISGLSAVYEEALA
jgi:glycosyltransferase involved in cell wall biosynthesis